MYETSGGKVYDMSEIYETESASKRNSSESPAIYDKDRLIGILNADTPTWSVESTNMLQCYLIQRCIGKQVEGVFGERFMRLQEVIDNSKSTVNFIAVLWISNFSAKFRTLVNTWQEVPIDSEVLDIIEFNLYSEGEDSICGIYKKVLTNSGDLTP